MTLLEQNIVLNANDFPVILKGDGITDDTVALQTALDVTGAEQRALWLTNGATYKITAPLLIKYNNFKLFGNHATIKYVGSVGNVFDAQLISGAYPTSIVVQDLNISLQSTGASIAWNHRFSNSHLRNVNAFLNFPGQQGFVLPADATNTGPHNNTFQDCNVTGSGNAVVSRVGAPAVHVNGLSNATYSIVIVITTGGLLGTAIFKWSSDGGSIFTTGVMTEPSVVLGATGLTAYFASGTYQTNDTYTCQTAQLGWNLVYNGSVQTNVPTGNRFIGGQVSNTEFGWNCSGAKNAVYSSMFSGCTGVSINFTHPLSRGVIGNAVYSAQISGDTNATGIMVNANAADTAIQDVHMVGVGTNVTNNSTTTKINESLVFNVRDFPYGARGDGITDDTAAIQAAISAAETLTLSGNTDPFGDGGEFLGTQVTVFFPSGTYRITSPISLAGSGFYIKILGENSFIFPATYSGSYTYLDTTDIFTGVTGKIRIEKMTFRRGRNAISVSTNNNFSQIRIRDCTFSNQHGTAIITDNTSPSTTMSVESCEFDLPLTTSTAINTAADECIVRDSTFIVGCASVFIVNPPSPIQTAPSRLKVIGCFGNPLNANGVWCTLNSGEVIFEQSCRLGGESGGFVAVDGYAIAGDVDLSTPPSAIIIHDCEVNTGLKPIVRCWNTPNVLSIQRNTGGNAGVWFDPASTHKTGAGTNFFVSVNDNSDYTPLTMGTIPTGTSALSDANLTTRALVSRKDSTPREYVQQSDKILEIDIGDTASYGSTTSAVNGTLSGSVDIFGQNRALFTATSNGGQFQRNFANVMTGQATGTYTLSAVINILNIPTEVQIVIGSHVKHWSLPVGRHVLSLPFYYDVSIGDSNSLSVQFLDVPNTGQVALQSMWIVANDHRQVDPYITTYGSALPTEGRHQLGDIILNTSPTLGTPKGWVCTTAGNLSATAWIALHPYATGQTIFNGSNGIIYEAAIGGVSDSAGPPTAAVGFTQLDGSVTWIGRAKATYLGFGDTGVIYNVKAYGAKGDGTTNDAAAINAAITAAALVHGTVYFPATPTSYKVTSAINLASGVKLQGAFQAALQNSSQGSVISFSGASAGFVVPNNVFAAKLEDLTMVGDSTAGPLVGQLAANSSAQFDIENCQFILGNKNKAAIQLGAAGNATGVNNNGSVFRKIYIISAAQQAVPVIAMYGVGGGLGVIRIADVFIVGGGIVGSGNESTAEFIHVESTDSGITSPIAFENVLCEIPVAGAWKLLSVTDISIRDSWAGDTSGTNSAPVILIDKSTSTGALGSKGILIENFFSDIGLNTVNLETVRCNFVSGQGVVTIANSAIKSIGMDSGSPFLLNNLHTYVTHINSFYSGIPVGFNSGGGISHYLDQTFEDTISVVNGLNSNLGVNTLVTSFARFIGSPSAPVSVGGISIGQAAGTSFVGYYALSQPLTIVNEDASSTAANRITTLSGANVGPLTGPVVFELMYDGNTSRWLLMTVRSASSIDNFDLVTTTTSYPMTVSDEFIMVGAISAPITVTLLASTFAGREVTIKDSTGVAATHNITISGNGNNIDGSSSFLMNENYQSVSLVFNGVQWSVV